MAADAFAMGDASVAAARALAVGAALHGGLTLRFTLRAFQARLADRWSATGATAVLFALAVVLWQDGAQALPAPFSVGLVVVYLLGIAVTLTYTAGRYHDRIDRFRERFGDRLNALLSELVPEERAEAWRRIREQWQQDAEMRRKTPHLMMGLFLALYAALGFLLLRGIWRAGYGGGCLDGAPEGIWNLCVASHGPWLAGGHLVAVFGLFVLLFAIAPTEFLRLQYPELSYPFKQTILSRLREREVGLFGAHFYIVAALPLAALWVARDPATWPTTVPAVVALLSVTVFADSASALFGMRWGRRRLPHNAGKTWIGAWGGTAVAFLVALPLTGWTMAAVTAAVFLVLDLAAPVPVPVSDNILNPVGLAVAYVLGAPWLDPMIPYY